MSDREVVTAARLWGVVLAALALGALGFVWAFVAVLGWAFSRAEGLYTEDGPTCYFRAATNWDTVFAVASFAGVALTFLFAARLLTTTARGRRMRYGWAHGFAPLALLGLSVLAVAMLPRSEEVPFERCRLEFYGPSAVVRWHVDCSSPSKRALGSSPPERRRRSSAAA